MPKRQSDTQLTKDEYERSLGGGDGRASSSFSSSFSRLSGEGLARRKIMKAVAPARDENAGSSSTGGAPTPSSSSPPPSANPFANITLKTTSSSAHGDTPKFFFGASSSASASAAGAAAADPAIPRAPFAFSTSSAAVSVGKSSKDDNGDVDWGEESVELDRTAKDGMVKALRHAGDARSNAALSILTNYLLYCNNQDTAFFKAEKDGGEGGKGKVNDSGNDGAPGALSSAGSFFGSFASGGAVATSSGTSASGTSSSSFGGFGSTGTSSGASSSGSSGFVFPSSKPQSSKPPTLSRIPEDQVQGDEDEGATGEGKEDTVSMQKGSADEDWLNEAICSVVQFFHLEDPKKRSSGRFTAFAKGELRIQQNKTDKTKVRMVMRDQVSGKVLVHMNIKGMKFKLETQTTKSGKVLGVVSFNGVNNKDRGFEPFKTKSQLKIAESMVQACEKLAS